MPECDSFNIPFGGWRMALYGIESLQYDKKKEKKCGKSRN